MERFWFSGLRTRLILLVFIAIIPAFMIIIYTGLELRKYARIEAFGKAQDFSKEFSKDHQRLIEAARHILFTLSQMPQIQKQNAAESSEIFKHLLKHTRGYTSFSAINLNGDVFASAHPLEKPINLADRPWFKQAVRTRGFVIGEYLIDRISGKPAVVLAYPVLDEIKNLKMILATGLDLEQLYPLLTKGIFPEGSSFNVIDSDGTILLRHPEPEKYVGRSMPEASIIRTVLTRREGVEGAAGLDGVPRLFGFTSLGEGMESLHVAVGIPEKIAFEESNRILARNLIFLSLIGILSLGAAWFGGGLLVLQPVNRLLRVTNRLAEGDLTVRSGLSMRQGEIGRLAHSFDQMADSLERRERALNDSEKRFKELYDRAPVGYHEYDAKGLITNVNQTELDMLGYTREEMIGRPVWEFNVEEEIAREHIKELLAGSSPPVRALERAFKRKDGTTFPVLIEARLIQDEKGRIKGIRSTIHDITERNRSEKEKRLLEEKFYQSQKMEAIGKLAGGIAHDFNNVLTIIKGYSQLSLLDLKEGDPLRGNIEEIERASERAANLTRQILAFSRRQPMEMQVLDLNHVLKNLDKMLRRMIGEDIDLAAILSEDLGRVMADPGQIEQVIMNLAVNARDAMPGGGKLTLETANVDLDEEYARNHIAVTPGRYVMLSVSDTGVGMTPEVRDRVFEPFFTTKEKGKGTGLGLSTVYGIVKQSGGNIWVYSEPGEGTTFKIYLARVDELPEEAGEKVVQKEFLGGSETILLVEDEEEVRQVALQVLTKNGYTVLEASHGEEARQICEEHGGPIHLILTDVVLPGMNGRDLVESIASRHPGAKALYMSGYTNNTIAYHGILEKGIHFLQKPFNLEDLLRKIRETLDK